MIEKTNCKGLIKTIEDSKDVEYFSEDSDVEVEFQPSKQKIKRKTDFDHDFDFMSSNNDYNKDTWNDVTKYIKRKAKTKVDDKINKIRESQNKDDVETEDLNNLPGDDIYLSEDELEYDRIKTKEKKNKKNNENNDFFEDADIDRNIGSFYQMNISRPLLKAITEMNFIHPTPIQAATIPVALLGRDICGCAATGTGKTAAYMLPTLERLLFRPSGGTSVTRVLVLVPTRELGVQVYQVTKQICQFSDIQIALAVGGLDLKVQELMLRKNPDIVIATPGRLIDHLKGTPTFTLDSIEVLILDEADRMLDEYFAEQMKEIIKQCSRQRQTMLFSATMSDEVENLAAVSLNKPVRVFVDNNKDVAFNLRQEFIRIRTNKETDREAILSALICRTFREHCMVFVQTKKQAHRLHIVLGLLGLKVAELHGNLTQPQRLEALRKFKDEEVDILVATDVAARGLDIQGVQTVINYVMPTTLEHYIHRVGRTARAGRAGVSVSLAGEQERKIVKDIIKRARQPVKGRVIPPEILEKYKVKLKNLDFQVTAILQEEYEERLLNKTENQFNRAEKILKGEKNDVRPWFQTKSERKDEKERLNNKFKDKNNKKKKDKTNIPDEKNDKIARMQAKSAKRKQKQKKISAVQNDVQITKTIGNKRKSNFDALTNTSFKNAKKLRYQPKETSERNRKFGSQFMRKNDKKK
ncbi:unnamed protein product [Brassicogethes aeneus]|uniref:RNA helicase n=1 Tax=Brassicogethes aeneus TaxID=1431903 RepID=A0A9P0AWI8_BRAAE|nr:unnamed protein product [Brassicogethes aeneus]